MDSCDVLALPSIAEGRALVQQEAMSRGLPIIVTANAGGEDLVDEERTGFLVAIRSPEAIAEKIAWFADHRDRLPAMREWTMAKARERSWETYGRKILAALNDLPGRPDAFKNHAETP
jgi:glycosyltransferase involved in cell wall biosynthesis